MFGTRESEDHLQIIGIFQISPGSCSWAELHDQTWVRSWLFLGRKHKICHTTSIDYLYYVISIQIHLSLLCYINLFTIYRPLLNSEYPTCFVIAIAFQVYIIVTQRNPCALPNRTHRIISHDWQFLLKQWPKCAQTSWDVVRSAACGCLVTMGIHVQRDTNETGTQLRYLHVVKGLGCEEIMKRQKSI